MLHPFVSTLIRQPDLVLDHFLGYGGLVREELQALGGQAVRRVVAWGIVLVMGLVAVLLAGTAVMVGLLQDRFHWALVAVPGLPLVVMVIAWAVARKPLPAKNFQDLRHQLNEDRLLFKNAGRLAQGEAR